MLTERERKVVRLRIMLDSGEARELIESAGLSYRRIGQEVGADASAVWRWFQGTWKPTPAHAVKLFRLLEQVADAQRPISDREAS